jgi:hypothetical protein
MTTYTVSYFIKNAAYFEEGATVTEVGNGWFRVVKLTDVMPPMDPLEHAKTLVFPIDSVGHNIEIGVPVASYVPPKLKFKDKRKAELKQNLLARFTPRSRT